MRRTGEGPAVIGIHIVSGPRIAPALVGTLSDADRSVDWTQAACRGEDPELWFPESGGRDLYGQARATCQRCPIRERCLEYAMKREGGYGRVYRAGMWGGLTSNERYQLSKERKATA